ncbi:MAG TPA: hypothetical protein VFE60_10140 [Roseiarcus sp.]|jgi:hypothetical protein|nr:hypothetical protein [Roseiarcus sp.]
MKLDPLSPEEFAKRAAPGGRLPIKGAKNTVAGDARYTPIGDATPAAIAAAQERHETRAKPDLVAKRQREGK